MTQTAVRESPLCLKPELILFARQGMEVMLTRPVKWKLRQPGLNLEFSGLEAGYYCGSLASSGWVLRSRGGPSGCWNDRTYPAHCPIGNPGDRFWVQEKFYIDDYRLLDLVPPQEPDGLDRESIYYRVDGDCCTQIPECECASVGKPRWHAAKWMPRWASRLTLEIVTVRVQRFNGKWQWAVTLKPIPG